jgi:hypothetical protein
MRWAVLMLVGASILLSACAKPPIAYYWGDYSASLYNAKKGPTEETLQTHKKVLVQIIQESNRQSLRVPPGVYAEYGYLLLKEGKAADGMKYLDLEAQTYPESRVFVERVKAQASQPAGEKEPKQ